MRSLTRLLPGLVALALILAAPTARAAGVGDPAPAFAAETDVGPRSLADYAGKKLVLAFYPKDFTGG